MLAMQKPYSTLAAKAYAVLKDRITSGQIPPGTNLARRRLSKELGVSAIPIMEALWRLEQDGLVESKPLYGARVRTLSADSIRDELTLREAIECHSARLCAENATEKQFQFLRKLARQMDEIELAGNFRSKEGVELHTKVHLTIAEFSGSRVLVKELERVGYRELMRLKWSNANVAPPPPNWHKDLVEACATKDPALAEEKMRMHVRFGLEGLWNALQILATFPNKSMDF